MIPSTASESKAIFYDRTVRSENVSLFEVRRAEPNDVAQIPALFEKVYGDSYENSRYVYSIESLTEKMSKRELTSIVAVTPEGRVIGHCALAKDNSRAGVGMATMSIVDPVFRNRGCESLMLAAVIEEARRDFLWGIASQAVTHHVFAQKAGQNFGFKRVGLQVGLMSDCRIYDGEYPLPGRRPSMALGYLPLRHGPKTPIYPPAHHRDFIVMLFRDAGLGRIVSSPEKNAPPLNGRASLRLNMMTEDIAKITIDRYSMAIFRFVEELLQDLRAKNIRYISLELPLGNPFTATACSGFEQLGFFIAGIMPHSSVGDALVLQFNNNVRADYDDILVASDTLAAIKSYVQRHDPNR